MHCSVQKKSSRICIRALRLSCCCFRLALFADWLAQILWLRGVADFALSRGGAVECQRGAALFASVRRLRDDRNFVVAIREFEMEPEAAVGIQRDLFAVNPNLRIGMRAAIENDLGVDVHEKLTRLFRAKRLRAPACADRTEPARDFGTPRGF